MKALITCETSHCPVCKKKHTFKDKNQRLYCHDCYVKSREIDIDALYGLWNEGLNDDQISKKLNFHPRTIGKIRKISHWGSTKSRQTVNKNSKLMKEYGVDFRWGESNCVTIHPSEKNKHFICKAIVCFLLQKNGKRYVTEANTKNGIVDVYNLTDKIIIELETSCNDKKKKNKFNQLFDKDTMTEFYIFDLKREVPDDWEKAVKFFAKNMALDY